MTEAVRAAGGWRFLPRGEHALHPLLVTLLLMILVAKPLVDLGILPLRAMIWAMLLVILTGITVLDGLSRRTRRIMTAVILGGVAMQGPSLGSAGHAPAVIGDAGAVLSLSLLAAAILRQTFAPGRVTLRRIEGALAAYLLMGLIFASAYDAVNALAPGAFERGGVPVPSMPRSGDFFFFSMITQTTTGYGDIVPVHPVARSLAILQVITGTLFTTVLLARLVSLELAWRVRE
jgi:hypothetical protein